MRILLVAAVFSIIIEVSTAEESHKSTAWIEGFAILVAVLVCANVTAINVVPIYNQIGFPKGEIILKFEFNC